MAGAGFKTFNTGDVLTSSDVNTYLMQQTVMVFDDASARSTALPTPSEGMFSYLKDTNLTYRYDGSAWLSDAGTTSPLTTKGDVWGYSTTDARIPVGANGTVLTADSAEALGVKWATAASGGMTLLNTGGTTLSGSSTSITSLSTSYNDLYVVIVGFRPASDGSDLYVQLNGDSGANRHYWAQPAFTDRTNISFDNTGIRATPATDSAGTNSLAVIHIPNYSNSTTWKFVLCYAISNNNTTATNFNWQSTQGAYNQTTAISSLNFFPGTSTMSAGTVYVYGVK